MIERIIFHIDVNNAFLSWTATLLLREGYKTDIRKIPSIIGGDESKRRGVVLAKSPIAKRYGIKTGETIYQAKQKCPYLQVFPPNHQFYSERSQELMHYLEQYTPLMEIYSIDECFLDFTGTKYLYKDYLALAHHIKDEIQSLYGYTVNIGIGNNKLCAKMASDFEKPNKVHTLFKTEIKEKLWPLEVGSLFMCGKKTAEMLNQLKIYTIKDLAKADEKILEKHFKSQAAYLKQAAWGIDKSKVEQRSNQTTSISTTDTLPYDYSDEKKLKEILFQQTQDVARELRRQGQYAKTVAVIFKNNKFQKYTAQAKLDAPTKNTKEIYNLVLTIFGKSYRKDPIRLIGVRLADLTDRNEQQLSLFQETLQEEEDEVQDTIDEINEKFGKALVAPASLKLVGKRHERLKK